MSLRSYSFIGLLNQAYAMLDFFMYQLINVEAISAHCGFRHNTSKIRP